MNIKITILKRFHLFIPILLIATLMLTGCQSSGNNNKSLAGTKESDSSEGNSTTKNSSVANTTAKDEKGLTALVSSVSKIAVDPEFTEHDLKTYYKDSSSTHIALSDNQIQVSGDGYSVKDGKLTINQKGTYVISGKLSNGQIIINAADADKVHLIFNGITVNCENYAPVYIKNADKVFITLNENTNNTLTDGSNYIQTDKNKVDAVIFSKADLAINGTGALNITANYKHGIVSKDKLVITGGNFHITSVKDAICGKNCVKIKDGTFDLESSKGKGITSEDKDNSANGYVFITGGTITIEDSYEGIEGTAILVEGGTFHITSQDDAFKASSADKAADNAGNGGAGAFTNNTNCYISFSG